MKFLRLRKSAEEINFEKDLMEAGKSKGKKDKVSEEQLEMGKEVEKEHTTNPEIAEKITRDHLEEIPDYYTHLKKMEDAVKKESAIQQPNKPKPTTTLPDNMEWSWDPNAADWVAVMKNNTNVTPPLYDPNNQNVVNQNTTSYMSTVKSASCLSKFLDGPQYSKEIKIEAGLIKEGLLKYAGFDFNRGTKYAITTKGLELLRKASEAEHNEALNEREKLAYLFGFNTDEVSTLDTTGKVLKQATSKKWTICEADGTELGEVVADSELDAKVKFGMEHPEYADSQSISAKEIDAKYEETTESHEPYPNPSETPTTDVILENHDGWVNTADQKRRPYTEEEKRMLPLFRLLNEHVAKKEIQLEEDPQKDGNIVATGQAEVINDLEHEVKELGFHCEPIAEITDNDYIGYDIYSLRIFTK